MADEITPKEEVKTEPQIEAIPEPISEPVQAPEPQTAQIPVNEPLPTPAKIEAEPAVETIPEETKTAETPPEELPPSAPLPEEKPLASSNSETSEPEQIKIQTESKPVEIISETKPEPVPESNPEPIPEVIPAVAVISKSKTLARELLFKARNMIQFRKRKKLNKIISLFAKQTKITNDEVEKFMHVSDATATRYLSQLEKENKIKQTGKTGKSVFYSLVK